MAEDRPPPSALRKTAPRSRPLPPPIPTPRRRSTYSIAGGADAAKFTIDASTGVLRFISAPNFEVPTDVGGDNVYDVTVSVTDGALTDTQSIAVTVTDINEAPIITSNGGGASAAISIAENGTAVTSVTGSDPEAATLTYSIIGGADASKSSSTPRQAC